jgi:PKD repeat protein
MIPTASRYPVAPDGTDNLYLVHDGLRVRLVEDYLPGQTSIVVEGDTARFPATGLLTLTEQVSGVDARALSFYYGSRTATTFDALEVLPGFTDVSKPRAVTNVTQNVMAAHHNNLKDAIIAVEEFLGVKGTVDAKPLGATLEGRINFLRKLVLRPRAWFTASKRIGIVPLTVEFQNLSYRGPITQCWDFGDGTAPSTLSCQPVSTVTISSISNLVVPDPDEATVTKTYFSPGIFDVRLTVGNEFGEDMLVIPNYITARVAAPDEATLSYAPDNATQALIGGVLHTRTNALVAVAVDDNGEQAGDAVTSYKWDLQDDLTHLDAPTTKGSYSVGGFYDVRLRVQTRLGAYRTTIFRNAVNVIEKSNLWLMVTGDTGTGVTKNFKAYEFGLVSETFKLNSRTSQSVTRDTSAVSGSAAAEWRRNVGFTPRNTTGSGDKGAAVVYWTETAPPGISIRFKEYAGFTDTWSDPTLTTLERGWNWVGFNTGSKLYFILGSQPTLGANTPGNSPTNQRRHTVNLNNYTVSTTDFDTTNFKNGAEELQQNAGFGAGGDYSVYRSCWKDHTGFLVRNDGVGSYFRLRSFYRTEGTLADEFQFFRKLPDMPGSTRVEGQLVPLTGGVYFFDNTGEIAVWNDLTEVWLVGSAATPYRTLQDQTVAAFDDPANRLVATSDGDRKAYLSLDYSSNVFLRYNEATKTYGSLGGRPSGEQLLAGVY